MKRYRLIYRGNKDLNELAFFEEGKKNNEGTHDPMQYLMHYVFSD